MTSIHIAPDAGLPLLHTRWNNVLPTSWQFLAAVIILLVLGLVVHAETCMYILVAHIEGFDNSWVAEVAHLGTSDWSLYADAFLWAVR